MIHVTENNNVGVWRSVISLIKKQKQYSPSDNLYEKEIEHIQIKYGWEVPDTDSSNNTDTSTSS
jgi:hypothetical protein